MILRFSRYPDGEALCFLKIHFLEKRMDNSGEPLAAVYLTPTGKNQEMVKEIIRSVQSRLQYACDEEERGGS